jgi:fructose-specific phosphotransferase system IIA component
MDISIDDVINEQLVVLDIPETQRDKTIEAMAERLQADGRLSDPDAYVREVLKREEEGGGTGMEMGVAIPHAKSAGVERASVVFARSPEGVDFGGDGGPCRLIFMIAAPSGSDDLHITLLAKLARRLVHESFRNRLLEAGTPSAALGVIREEVSL